MAVLTYKGGKYRNLAGNKIYDGSKWLTMGGDSKIFLDGKWHDFSWKKAELPDVPDEPEIPSWDDFTHLVTEEPTEGTVYYMTPSGTGAMDGSSWDNAWSASQSHIAILSMSYKDRLYMAEGDYGTLEIPLQPSNAIWIYGGFIEGDYSWSTRDSVKHPTVWSGNGTIPFSSESVTIDGLTLKNFFSTDVQIYGTNITAIHCTFDFNALEDWFLMSFTNCRFSGNSDDKVVCASASNCYFLGEKGSLFPVYIKQLSDSVVVRCTAGVYGNFDNYGNRAVICYEGTDTKFYEAEIYERSTYIAIIAFNAGKGCEFIRCKAAGITGSAFKCSMIGCEGIIDDAVECKVVACSGSLDSVNGMVVSCNLSELDCSSSIVVGCTVTSLTSDRSRVINTTASTSSHCISSLLVNSVVEDVISVGVWACTFVNSSVSLKDSIRSISNIFWNNNGTIPAEGNAQTAYNADNVLTLGTDNSIARFVNTGYAPAIGVQDVGECPNPINDPEGFEDYVASFGDWHPQADSFLIGKGLPITSGAVGVTDLDGVTRPDPPTIGAYEPRPTETEQ